MDENYVKTEELVALLEINNELSRIESFDMLCRRAVELASGRLGFDRIGIWFKGEDPGSLVGSFGIDEQGKVRDERNNQFVFSKQIIRRLSSLRPSEVFQYQGNLYDNLNRKVGSGNWACAVLWSGNESFGCVFVDNLLTHRSINIEILKIFAATFGHLCALKQTQESLRKSEERYRELWDNAPVAYHTVNMKGIITGVNKTEAAMLGYTQKEMVGRPFFDFIIPEHRADALRRFNRRLAGKRSAKSANLIYIKKNNVPIMVFIEDRLEKDSRGKVVGVWMTMVDVTEQKKAEETIKRFAYNDVVTGLPNRHFFNERLAVELLCAARKKQKFFVILLDIDRFKRINDSLGHAAGDHLLKAMGERLRGLLRKSDIIARMGGDEFLILVTDLKQTKDISMIIEKIRRGVAAPFFFDNNTLMVTVSLGLAIYPKDGRGGESLIKNADIAMYAAKKAGRNTWKHFRSGMQT